MIGKLTGKLDISNLDHIILDVQGVGYHIFIPSKLIPNLGVSEIISLYIETHVREDRIQLFGFQDYDEKLAFNLLKNVSGIGPKMALQILSHITPYQLQTSITQQDKAIFKSISGIGPKLAEKILLELKGKHFCQLKDLNNSSVPCDFTAPVQNDAIAALIGLGLHSNEAMNLASKIYNENPHISASELIKSALQMRHIR